MRCCVGEFVFLVCLLSTAQAGFVINTTAGFDAGLKSNSSGNYEVETYTDNLNISNNTFALGNKYSDRFTFPDADADTFKWTYSAYGDFLTNEVDIDTTVAGKLHYRVEYDEIGGTSGYIDAIVFQDTKIGGDFDIETKWSNWSIEGTANDWLCFGVFDINDSSSYTFDPVICRNYAGGEHFYIAYGGLTPAQVNTTDTDGRFRLTRAITSGTEATYDLYYWNNTGSNWELLLSEVFSTSGYVNALDDLYVGYWVETATDAGEVVINFDDFKVNSGTLVSSPYRTSGNWTSETITLSGQVLKNTTIEYAGASGTNYIDKIEWLVGGVVKATYDTNIVAGSSATITAPTSGTFVNVNSDFQVRVSLVGDGTGSPRVSSIYGGYSTSSPAIITDNSVKMLWLINDNATLNDLASATGHTVHFNQSEFYTYLLPTTGNTWYAQSINETANYTMSGVIITLAESTARYIRYANLTFTVRIETDNSNKPSGTLANAAATATLNSTQILANTYSAQYYQAATAFIFNSTFNLTANTTYWIVLKPSGGTGYEYFATGYGRTNLYPRGNLSSTTNAGTLWTMGINDLWFYVLTPTKNSSAITYDAGTSTATLAAGWFIEIDGTGELVMSAGETLTGETVAAGQYIRVGVFGGGLLTMNGNSTSYVNIFTPNNATTRKDYPVMVYYMGRMKADYANITGYASGANLYINAVYGGFQIRNSYIKNLYANSAGYPVALTTGMFSTMNNCTIIKSHASYPIYMVAYAGQGIVLINNNVSTSSAYSQAIYNTATITYAGLTVVDNTFNGAPLGIGNITHAYSTGSTYIGHAITSRVLSNGTPVANASVSVMTQFNRNDLPNQLYGYGYTDRTVSLYPPANTGPSNQYDYGTNAITNANGYPKDDLGLNNLWVVDTAYIGTTKALYTYFGGSNSSIRPLGYTWKNDGTDYGYIITATDGNNSKSVVVNPNATYTTDISIYVDNATPTTPTYIFLKSQATSASNGDSSLGAGLIIFAIFGVGAVAVKYWRR
jgi:hypothetical protein